MFVSAELKMLLADSKAVEALLRVRVRSRFTLVGSSHSPSEPRGSISFALILAKLVIIGFTAAARTTLWFLIVLKAGH